MKIKRILTVVLILFMLATLAFVWGNSMQSIEASQAMSLGVLEKVKPALEVMAGVGNVTDHFVRKLAHFTEFAVLGIQLALLLIQLGCVRFQPVVNCAFFGLIVATLDETIQIFSYRGAQVQDIWLDFAGLHGAAGRAGDISARKGCGASYAQKEQPVTAALKRIQIIIKARANFLRRFT